MNSSIPCSLNNCLVYFNTAPLGANYDGSSLNYCCTTPPPLEGSGNISLDPQLASASHLSASSPCRGAGSAAYATGTDIDGEAWANPPSIGCDEYKSGVVSGPLSVRIAAAYTNVAVGFPVELTAFIEGRTSASVWEFGDGVVISNRPYATHAWTVPGDYAVVLRAYNESLPGSVSATLTIHIVAQPVHYVAANSPNPQLPFTSWGTAATNIQDAVDVATAVGALVLVGNGTYATGGRAVVGRMTNRVVVDKPLTLRSVNGPHLTVIQGAKAPGGGIGDGAVRCVYLANGASLSGFTLTNGATRRAGVADVLGHELYGGGVWCESVAEIVTNCVIAGNSAYGGGGVIGGTLYNCTLTGNSADTSGGGGAYASTLFSCTLTGNSADYGGGADGGTLHNCTLTGNAANYGGGATWSTLVNCTLTGNSAQKDGGGAASSTLYNCTLSGNSAINGGGGGASWSTLNNCIVYYNTALNGANYVQDQYRPLNFCCTTPLPTNGVGNITADPMFVDAAHGDFRLRPGSPCIDTGTDLVGLTTTDITGLPRPMDGNYDGLARFDMGAYEFNPYRFESTLSLGTDGFRFTIRGEPGRSVRIERSRDLVNWEFAGQIPIPASGQTLIDPAATSETKLFYRATRMP